MLTVVAIESKFIQYFISIRSQREAPDVISGIFVRQNIVDEAVDFVLALHLWRDIRLEVTELAFRLLFVKLAIEIAGGIKYVEVALHVRVKYCRYVKPYDRM